MKINSLSKNVFLAEKKFRKAKDLFDKGVYQRAASTYLEASKLFKKKKDTLNYTVCLSNAASSYSKNNEFKKAEFYLQRALEIQKKILKSNHPHIANSLNNLGSAYCNTRQFKIAENYYQQALQIREEIFESNHPEIANSLNNLGSVYYEKGKLKKAEEYFQRAKNIINNSPLEINGFKERVITNNLNNLQQEIKRLEYENLEMRAALHQANRLAYLGRMATMMAHNIKNPVNNIATATTSLLMGIRSQKISPEKQIESLERILRNTKRLDETIEKFRNQAQNDRSEREALNLNETLEDIFQLFFAGTYQLNGIEIEKDYSNLNPIAIANKDSIQEILITLLNNAKEAVNQQTVKKVTLNTWQTKDKVGFNIEDNGGGIEDEKLDKLFTPFASSKIEGMGLGLYFCKQIITDLNGDIDYYHASNGAGFRITLPFSTENNHGTEKI